MRKKIFVTGGSGLIARYVVKRFAEDENYLLYPVVSEQRTDFASGLYERFHNVRVITAEEFFDDKTELNDSVVIHTAFTRKNDGKEIVRSLNYTYKVFETCKKKMLKGGGY